MFEISTKEKYPSPHDRMIIYEPGKANKLSFPYWWLFADYLRAIFRAPISTSERLKCFIHMHIWMQRWGRGLLQDLMVAARTLYLSGTAAKSRRADECEHEVPNGTTTDIQRQPSRRQVATSKFQD